MSTFSIIIPIRPGGTPEALANLINVDLSASQIEILVAEGNNPSRQRNEAVRQAQGKIIYFLDDDSVVTYDCLKRLADHFADPMVTVVGGPSLTPTTDSLLQQAIGSALASALGAGGARNRYQSQGTIRKTTEKELILCNLAVRRSAFLSCGGFDERLYPNEENEFLDRLRASGGILLHDPQLVVQRSQRRTLAAFARQMFRYGQGRARQTRIAGFSGIMPFAPLFLFIYLLSLPFTHAGIWQTPALLYLLALPGAALNQAWKARKPAFALLLPFLYPLLHLANGAGLLSGFLLPLPQQACYKEEEIDLRRIPFPEPPDGPEHSHTDLP